MTIESSGTIDLIATNDENNTVTLAISDHLEWSDENKVDMLAEKIDSYLYYIDSGQLIKAYPDAEGMTVNILLKSMHKPNEMGSMIIDSISESLEEIDVKFECEY
ncbi:hypothetical protein R50073_01120 [Maricurvus nonylphenolicus]|uniref:DUF6572 domain-containing protein n=1 Tax=Maricurvus nonylphenolicus TaxID=1008307 RepID=UPI0036F27191